MHGNYRNVYIVQWNRTIVASLNNGQPLNKGQFTITQAWYFH